MQIDMLNDYRLIVLLELFLLGRRVRFHVRDKNLDRLLELTILVILIKENLSVSEMAKRVGTNISTVSEKINNLVKKRFIEKTKTIDGRVIILKITNKGLQILREIPGYIPLETAVKHVSLTKKEAEIFLSLLNKVEM